METIKSNDEISRVFSVGRRYSNRYVVFIAIEGSKSPSSGVGDSRHGLNGRVAFIAGKKLGNAVWRNSAKRRLREIYRRCYWFLNKFDVLLVARSSILSASYSKVIDACEHTLNKMRNDLETRNSQSD